MRKTSSFHGNVKTRFERLNQAFQCSSVNCWRCEPWQDLSDCFIAITFWFLNLLILKSIDIMTHFICIRFFNFEMFDPNFMSISACFYHFYFPKTESFLISIYLLRFHRIIKTLIRCWPRPDVVFSLLALAILILL